MTNRQATPMSAIGRTPDRRDDVAMCLLNFPRQPWPCAVAHTGRRVGGSLQPLKGILHAQRVRHVIEIVKARARLRDERRVGVDLKHLDTVVDDTVVDTSKLYLGGLKHRTDNIRVWIGRLEVLIFTPRGLVPDTRIKLDEPLITELAALREDLVAEAKDRVLAEPAVRPRFRRELNDHQFAGIATAFEMVCHRRLKLCPVLQEIGRASAGPALVANERGERDIWRRLIGPIDIEGIDAP